MCKVLGVSESGYYRYIGNKDKPGKDKVLSVAIKEILDENPLNDNYGVPRIQMALEQRRIRAGKRRITRIMRENGWLHTKKRRPHGLTKADPQAMITENLIKQDFSANAPYEKLLTDITQIQCKNGKLYISPILDCYNGEILSLIMRNNMKKELCIDTVKALKKYPVNGAILHSDRGSQYTSDELLRYGVQIVQSVIIQVAVTGRKDIAFAHLDRQLEEHFTQVFFESAEHQLDILTDDRRQIADVLLLSTVTKIIIYRLTHQKTARVTLLL